MSQDITPGARTRAVRRALRRLLTLTSLVRVLCLVALLTAWEVKGRNSNRLLFAPFSTVLRELWEQTTNGFIPKALLTSGGDLLYGFGTAAIVGVSLGLVIGRSLPLRDMASPYLSILLTTPMVALTPIVLFAFGIGQMARAALVFLFTLGQIMVNTCAGAQSVPAERLEMASAFGLGHAARLWQIVLPSASPAVMAGLRLGLGQSIIGVLIAELTVSPVGIGGLLQMYASRFETADVLAVILAIGIFSSILFGLATLIERRVCRWTET